MGRVTRRDFIKLASSAACAMASMPLVDVARALAAEAAMADTAALLPSLLGRVSTWQVNIHAKPDPGSRVIRGAFLDQVLQLRAQVTGKAVTPYNLLWYKTDDGFVHSAWIQPVENTLNLAEPDKAADKFWGEITVPFSDSRVAPDPRAARFFRLYFASVFRVVAAAAGKDDQWWYRLQDGITRAPGPYVPAAHIRRIDPLELAPISPEVTDKHIEVNLQAQLILAYEENRPVMLSRIASGYGDFFTPKGNYVVLCKSPASRMTGGQGADWYDLPGVPFPTYFTPKRAGIHGTYWHNDYGRPRSHGCLNVPPLVARWFWRWTMPVVPYAAATYDTPKGIISTAITVS